jgi:hypothetical protein
VFVFVLLPPFIAVPEAVGGLIPAGWGTLSIFYAVVVLAAGLLVLPVTGFMLADRGGNWSKASYTPIAVIPLVMLEIIAFSYSARPPYPAHVVRWSVTAALVLLVMLAVPPALIPLSTSSWTIGAALQTRARRLVLRDLARHIARRDELAGALAVEERAALAARTRHRRRPWWRSQRR